MNILVTSDWHDAPFASQKFNSQKKSLGERIIQIFGGIGKDNIMQKMKYIIKDRGIRYVIHNGDLQENTFNERGILIDEDLQSAQGILRDFKAQNNVSISLNMGNHESGYHKKTLPLATDPEGGVSLSSIARFLTLAGRESLYHSEVILGYRICFIPYILTEKCGKDFDIEVMKENILNHLEKDMAQKGEKVILFVHDPDSMSNERFLQIIQEHKDNIELFFCGHYHSNISLLFNKVAIRVFSSKWFLPVKFLLRLVLTIAFGNEISLGIERYYLERREIPKLMKKFNVRIIPAPDGMFGFGGGFMVLNLNNLEVDCIS